MPKEERRETTADALVRIADALEGIQKNTDRLVALSEEQAERGKVAEKLVMRMRDETMKLVQGADKDPR